MKFFLVFNTSEADLVLFHVFKSNRDVIEGIEAMIYYLCFYKMKNSNRINKFFEEFSHGRVQRSYIWRSTGP